MINKAEFLSQRMLFKAKAGESLEEYLIEYELYDEYRLFSVLSTDEQKLAFWINTYNAFSILFRKEKMGPNVLSKRIIKIAGNDISLNEIEQNILLCSRAKGIRGYMNNMFNSTFERKFRLEKPEKMVYFALTDGSDNTPPLYFYESFKIYDQLKAAVRQYLQSMVSFDQLNEKIIVPSVFKKNLTDFKGKAGIVLFLKKHKIIPSSSKAEIHFTNSYAVETV